MDKGNDIAIVLTARASWAKYETILEELLKPQVGFDKDGYDGHLTTTPVTLYACGGAMLPRYGSVVDVARSRFPQLRVVEVWSHFEGNPPIAAAKSTAALSSELATHFDRDKPSVVVVMADRYEVLAAAQAAAYLNIPVAHIQGGERTGSIDDRARDAITHLASFHFTATQLAGLRVCALVGGPERIRITGCPSIDIAHRACGQPRLKLGELSGSGPEIDPGGPYIFALQHSDTTVWEMAHEDMTETLHALRLMDRPVFLQWPNQDPGSEGISKAIRQFRDANPGFALHTLPNMPPLKFLRLVAYADCVVGNSSAGIRECSYLGTPVVNIGLRQQGRQRASNVLDVDYGSDRNRIADAIHYQLGHGHYPVSTLYGRGDAGQQIAAALRAIQRGDDVSADI